MINMDNNVQEFVNSVSENELEAFLKKTNSNFSMDTNTEKVTIDYSWVSKVEDCLPNIDAIIRNPRKFLIQEEEVTIVEKTKKVTKETIKHLTQNTNFIQDVTKDGEVKPKKLLNVYKEDTFDIYENRFFYTLLKRLVSFLDYQMKIKDDESYFAKARNVNFSAETYQLSENVKLNVTLETNHKKNIDSDTSNYKKRIRAIAITLYEFMDTPFVKSLRQASPVKNPIRRTNLILKDPNFRKCLDLWEFLDKYEAGKIVKKVNTNEKSVSDIIKNRYLYSYFLDYLALDFELNNSFQELYEMYLKRSIDECLNNMDMTDREYKILVDKNLKEVRKKQNKIKNDINKCYKLFIDTNNLNMNKNVDILGL